METNTSSFRSALQLALIFACIKLAIHVTANLIAPLWGYGYFRDELYYIVCGRHLTWGYVDQPPLVALQTRISESLFGLSLVGLRLLTALAGAIKVFLTGMLTWALGGSRRAQALAMTGVLFAIVFLAIDNYLSMNSFEPVFWMGMMLAVILIARGGDPRWWLLFGVLGGLGIENKHSTVFFLTALLLGLIVSPERRILLNRWVGAAAALIVLLALPNLLWQIHYHWPTWQVLSNIRHSTKNERYSSPGFVGQQILILGPINVLLWAAGLGWLLISKNARNARFVGIAFVLFFALMFLLSAKHYYLAPFYPVLFAAGAIAWSHTPKAVFAAVFSLVILFGAVLLPTAVPVLPPRTLIAYSHALHLHLSSGETNKTGPLMQQYADMFGWPQMTAEVARVYWSLSPPERSRARVFGQNYGEASAVNVLGPRYGLPRIGISGHQNYFFWGPQGYDGKVLIVIGGNPVEMRKLFDSVILAGHTDDPYSMPYEHLPIYICRGLKQPFDLFWAARKKWL